MALIPATLIAGFTRLGTPATMPAEGQLAIEYTNIIDSYASLVTPPTTTSAVARTTLLGILQGVSADLGNLEPLLVSGLSAYASALVPGMAPAFTGTPPLVPIVLSSVAPAGQAGATASAQASLISGLIDAWFRTGIAVNNTSGASIPWA